jgi:hypothetical protein
MGYNDYHFFGHLTKYLPIKQFATDADVKQPVTCWLRTRGAESSFARIQALVPRSDTHFTLIANTLKSGVYHLSHMCYVHNKPSYYAINSFREIIA